VRRDLHRDALARARADLKEVSARLDEVNPASAGWEVQVTDLRDDTVQDVRRSLLVLAGAVALVALGTLAHRQAPFVLGACALAFVAATRLGSYAPLLPPWVTLAAAGLVLLVLGATYERRLQQAREAVAWVAQMS